MRAYQCLCRGVSRSRLFSLKAAGLHNAKMSTAQEISAHKKLLTGKTRTQLREFQNGFIATAPQWKAAQQLIEALDRKQENKRHRWFMRVSIATAFFAFIAALDVILKWLNLHSSLRLSLPYEALNFIGACLLVLSAGVFYSFIVPKRWYQPVGAGVLLGLAIACAWHSWCLPPGADDKRNCWCLSGTFLLIAYFILKWETTTEE